MNVHAKNVRIVDGIVYISLDDMREIRLPLNEMPQLKWLGHGNAQAAGELDN